MWVAGSVVYLLVGVGSAFFGSGARIRHRQKVIFEWKHDRFVWKLKALLLGIVVFWPLYLASRRKELGCWISAIQDSYPGSLPYYAYQQVMMSQPEAFRDTLRKCLSELGYVVTGFAADSKTQDVPVAVSIAASDTSFTLIRLLDQNVSLWPRATRQLLLGDGDVFSLPPEARQLFAHSDDEVWEFTSDGASWQGAVGRAGLARVQNGVITQICVLAMS